MQEDFMPKELIDKLRTSKEAYKRFYEKFKNQYIIAGKLATEWEKHFKVDIPEDLTTQGCIIVSKKLLDLHQEASSLKAVAQGNVEYIKAVYNKEYKAAFSKVIAEHKASQEKPGRLPSHDTISTLAEEALLELKETMVHAEIELNFWKEILNDLANARRIVSDLTINLGIEAKALYNERMLDRYAAPKGE